MFNRQKVDPFRIPEAIRAKWSNSVLEEGFVPFPKKLLRSFHEICSGEQGIKELCILLAIVDYKRPTLSRLPSFEYLAFLAGLEEPELKSIIAKLEDRGWIKVREKGEGLDIEIQGFLAEIDKHTEEEDENLMD